MVRRTRATYQDVIDAPEDKIAELIDGELVLSPHPAPRHSRAGVGLLEELYGPFDRGRGGPGGWIILLEVELWFDDRETVLVPDACGWRRERLPVIPDAGGISVAPDWVCEILSPSTERIDRHKKMRIYAQQGVAWVWLVDPVDRALEVYRREPEGYLLLGIFEGDQPVRVPPFDAVPIQLASLWRDIAAAASAP